MLTRDSEGKYDIIDFLIDDPAPSRTNKLTQKRIDIIRNNVKILQKKVCFLVPL